MPSTGSPPRGDCAAPRADQRCWTRLPALGGTDIATLVGVFDRLLDDGATVIVIDHDLDLLAAADHLIDMGPVGGPLGGRIVAEGRPAEVAADPASVTGDYLRPYVTAATRR
jgi:excinuclease ABC subunit A